MHHKHKAIGMKELQHTLAQVAREASAGKSFVVFKHARPAFRIEPITHREKNRYTLRDLNDIRFKARDRNLSAKVDDIVYGI